MTMKQTMHRILALLLALGILLSLAACSQQGGGTQAAEDIVNGDFEENADGKWVGWTREDAAFNARGVVSDEKINNVPMEKSGDNYFAGSKGGNPVMRGTLTSDVFKLGGNGFITFKMGAGKDHEKVYVEFFQEGNDTPIAHVANEDCDGIYITEHLITKVVNLSQYIGKNIYIVATDNDDGSDLAYVNLDAFHVCQSDDEVAAAQAEHDRQIEEYGEKPFEEDPTSNDIVNGGFETGDTTGWLVVDGTALTVANVVPTSQYYWEDRSVYGDGEYYLDGSNNGATQESLTGAIRSTKFTLGGDGYITKPFSLMVLRARIDKALKRRACAAENVYADDRYRFDFDRMEFTDRGAAVELSKTEQKLLRLLVRNKEQTLTRDFLVDRIWTDGAEYVDENALSVTVNRLRKKLDAADVIRTVYGIGYVWSAKGPCV